MSARSKREEHVAFPRFEVEQANGQISGHWLRGKRAGWYWRLVARNGETLCHAEMFRDVSGAKRSIRSAVRAVRDMVGGFATAIYGIPVKVIR